MANPGTPRNKQSLEWRQSFFRYESLFLGYKNSVSTAGVMDGVAIVTMTIEVFNEI